MSLTDDLASDAFAPTAHQNSHAGQRLIPVPSIEESFDVQLDLLDSASGKHRAADSASARRKSYKRCQRARVFWTACLLLLLIALARHYYAGICEAVFAFFTSVKQFPEPFRSALFWTSSFAVQILSIPIACIVTVVISYCYASYWGGYALSLSVCLAVNLLMIKLLDRRGQRSAQTEQTDSKSFSDFLAKTVESMMRRYPYVACGLVRSLHVPDGAKVYILTRFRLKLLEYLLPMLVVESLNVFLYSFVGYQIKDRFDLINPTTFSNKSLAQKISTISVYVLLLLQAAVLLSGLSFTYLRYREYRQTLSPQQQRPRDRQQATPDEAGAR